MQLLSNASEYALRAVVWMASEPRGESHKVRDIAERTQSAPGYLVKVLQGLAKANILSAQRGSRGGYTLERDPARLTVLDIINATDPFERITTCPLKSNVHGSHLCLMHRKIDDAIASIEGSFRSVTIADLLAHQSSSHSSPLCDDCNFDPP